MADTANTGIKEVDDVAPIKKGDGEKLAGLQRHQQSADAVAVCGIVNVAGNRRRVVGQRQIVRRRHAVRQNHRRRFFWLK